MPTDDVPLFRPDGIHAGAGRIEPPVDRAPRFQRRWVLPAVVAIQTCLGGVYAWSAFAAALRADFALSVAQTQSVFGLTIAAMTLSMAIAGRWIGRLGTRRLAMCGGLLFGLGHGVSAASGGDLTRILAGSGLLVGISMGLGYVSALTAVAQWYPRNKGLVIGVTVAGFGAGSILLSALIAHLLRGGIPVLDLFQVVGAVYATVILLAGALLFRAPAPAPDPVETRTATPPRLDRNALPLLVGIFSGTFAGLMVIGHLASLGMEGGLSFRMATAAIGGFAVGNTAGRILWGWLADRYGYRTIPISLVFLAVTLVGLYAARNRAGFFLPAAALTGFGFGANFVLYAAQVAARHGPQGLALLYPQIFLAYGLAAMTGPPLSGFLHDRTGSLGPAIGIAVMLLLAATGITAAFAPTPHPKSPGGIHP